jgi:hypothetical protein
MSGKRDDKTPERHAIGQNVQYSYARFEIEPQQIDGIY